MILSSSGKANVLPCPALFVYASTKLISDGREAKVVEFWDIGGHPDAAAARRTFLEDSLAAGVLLVYDASNPRCLCCFYELACTVETCQRTRVKEELPPCLANVYIY